MKKILYIHGLGGGANGRLPQIFRKMLGEDYEVFAPEIPFDPEIAMPYVRSIASDCDVAVASSLGAFYLMLTDSPVLKILINPAVLAGEYVEKYVGRGLGEFHVERQNGQKEFVIDDEFINVLKAMERRPDEAILRTISCFVSPEDDLFGPRNAAECTGGFFLPGSVTLISGPHSIEEDMVEKYIVPEIKAL